MSKLMNKVVSMYMYVRMVVVLSILSTDDTKVRLYYHRKASKLSMSSMTPLGWVTTKRNATHYVDIPMGLLVGKWECYGHDYSTHNHIRTYDIYVLKGSANRYAKRACREVI